MAVKKQKVMADVKMNQKNSVPQRVSNQQVNIKKSKKGRAGKVIAFIVIFILLAAFVACFYLDVAGIRTKTADFIAPATYDAQKEEEERKNLEYFEEQNAQIELKKKELAQLEAELKQRESAIIEKEQEIIIRVQGVEKREIDIDSKERDVRSVAKIYEDMDEEVAAKILMRYEDKNEVAQIVKNLSDEKAADILSEMDTSYAAGLLRIVDSSNTTTKVKEVG